MLLLSGFRSCGGEVSAATHLAKPKSLFCFRDVHLIREERKKKPPTPRPLSRTGEKGFCLAGTGRCCGGLKPVPQLVCSQILLSTSYPKCAARLDIRVLLCLLRGDVCRCFVFPISTWVIGGNKCPTKLVVKLYGAATYFLSASRSTSGFFVFSRFWGKGRWKVRLHLS